MLKFLLTKYCAPVSKVFTDTQDIEIYTVLDDQPRVDQFLANMKQATNLSTAHFLLIFKIFLLIIFKTYIT